MSAQGFQNPYGDMPDYSGAPASPNSFWNKASDALGLSDYQGEYDRWSSQKDREYEQWATNSARAWDEYMDSTKYQRMVKDLEAAGLNPWLAIQSGLGSGGSTTTASSGSSARYQSSKKNENVSDAIKSFALTVIAGAKIMALLV